MSRRKFDRTGGVAAAGEGDSRLRAPEGVAEHGEHAPAHHPLDRQSPPRSLLVGIDGGQQDVGPSREAGEVAEVEVGVVGAGDLEVHHGQEVALRRIQTWL